MSLFLTVIMAVSYPQYPQRYPQLSPMGVGQRRIRETLRRIARESTPRRHSESLWAPPRRFALLSETCSGVRFSPAGCAGTLLIRTLVNKKKAR